MSYTFLLEGGGESSAACFSDIPLSVRSKLNRTHGASCSNGNETDSSLSSPFGMTLQRSMGVPGGGTLMWYVGDSPVRTYQPPDMGVECEGAHGADSGPSKPGSLAKYSPASYSWKTAQCLLAGGLTVYSETFPAWGTMRDGECYPVTMPVALSIEIGYGLLPAPRKSNGKDYLGVLRRKETWATTSTLGPFLIGLWKNWTGREYAGATRLKITCHPTFCEYLMGWPLEWTQLKPLATDRFQRWLRSHGRYCLDATGRSRSSVNTQQPDDLFAHPITQEGAA